MIRGALVLFFLLWTCPAQEKKEAAKTPRQYVEQGMSEFKAGKIAESISSFETAARLRPEVRPHLWQLGISYYYARQFEKGQRLFESHQTVNPQDVENAIWHFLCVTRVEGLDAARQKFIPITDDRRVPMKELHGLFAGNRTEKEVLEAAATGKPSEAVLKEQMFYAHLYLGLYEEALKHPKESLAHIKQAAGEFSQPHYMGSVAHVHLKVRAESKPKNDSKLQ